MAFTDDGFLKMKNAIHALDARPLQADIETEYAHLSRGYIRHLFQASEMLGPTLLSLHNLAYYARLVRQAREAIAEDRFMEFFNTRMAGWAKGKSVS